MLKTIRDGLQHAGVVHVDETGFRVAGKLHWVHSASTPAWSLLSCHPRRGRAAIDAMGVLPGFTGTVVHDAWAPYDTVTTATHALCNAHVLRELVAVIDTAKPGAWCWAQQAADALLHLKNAVETATAAGQTRIDPGLLARHQTLFASAATIGIEQNTGNLGALAAKQRALARRLLTRQEDYLRFATDFTVPFDNNAAEREIRMIKTRQKISGSLRTLAGAEAFCATRSYLATAKKHGIRYYDALTTLTEGQPWAPA